MSILVVGAGGYLGSRLVPELLARGHDVRAGFTDPTRAATFAWGDRVDAVRCDVLDPESLESALDGVDSVVYLVHRMGAGPDFRAQDAAGATSMRRAMDAAGTRRCVYLSGVAPTGGGRRPHSQHMLSRREVEDLLSAGSTPVLTLRAGVVLGAGSTSFEVLRTLCERLPLQPVPLWMRHKVEPVAERDVVEALCCAVQGRVRSGHADLGCGEVLTYPGLLRRFSRIARLPTVRVPLIGVPWDLVSAGLAPIIAQDAVTVGAMIESLHHDMICVDRPTDLLPAEWKMTGVDDGIRAALRNT